MEIYVSDDAGVEAFQKAIRLIKDEAYRTKEETRLKESQKPKK